MKDIKRFILESSINEFSCNISQVESGKYNDMLLFKKIIKSIDSDKDTYISVECGRAGVCVIKFSNFEEYRCKFTIRFKDLGKYIDSKEVDSEYIERGNWKDLYQKMINMLLSIQRKLGLQR